MGDRDSEIAIVVEDTELIESVMNGQKFMATRFAATFRRQLFKQHLGLIPPQDCPGPVDSAGRPVGRPNEYEFGTEEDRTVQVRAIKTLFFVFEHHSLTNCVSLLSFSLGLLRIRLAMPSISIGIKRQLPMRKSIRNYSTVYLRKESRIGTITPNGCHQESQSGIFSIKKVWSCLISSNGFHKLEVMWWRCLQVSSLFALAYCNLFRH